MKSGALSVLVQGPKRTLVYSVGLDQYQALKDYNLRGGITALGPQVYGLDNSGNITQTDSHYPYTDTTFAPNAKSEYSIDVVPLIAAGAGLS